MFHAIRVKISYLNLVTVKLLCVFGKSKQNLILQTEDLSCDTLYMLLYKIKSLNRRITST